MNNETDIGIKFTNSIAGQDKLDKYAQQLATIKSALNGLDKGTMSALKDSAVNVKDVSDDVKDMSKKVSTAFNFSAVKYFTKEIKTLTATLAKTTKASMEYVETLNLYEVAFSEVGKTIDETTKDSDEFINKLTEMYGLDEAWLTKTVGLFKQLSNAMGLSGETGSKLSKVLTQLSIDASSLYNVDTDVAVSKFTSALAGQTKPVRAFGADITEATLQQTLSGVGIDKGISSLSYAEKRLVIVISLLQQMQQVTNDWGKTIESPANQTRILAEQWARLTRTVGNVFLPIVTKLLPYLNAILMVMTEIISTIASLFGYKVDDFDYGMAAISDDMLDIGENAEAAAGSVKKLKSGLRGFDKLNNITSPSSTGSAGAGGGGTGVSSDILSAFNKAYSGYMDKLKNVSMKATEIRDKIMEWLGFTKLVDEKTKEVSFKFEKITSGTVLGALGVGGVIYTGIKMITKMFSKWTGIKLPSLVNILPGSSSLATIGLIIAAVALLAAALYDLYKNNEEFAKSINEKWENIKTAIEPVTESLKGLFDELTKAWNETVKPMFVELWEIIKTISEGIVDVLYPIIVDFIIPAIGLLVDVIKDIVEVINEFWQEYGKPISDAIKDAIEGTVDLFKYLWDETLKPRFEDMFSFLKELWDDTLKPLWKNVSEFIGEVIELILNLYNKVLLPLIKFVVDKLAPIWETTWGNIKNVVGTVVKYVGGYISGVIEIIKGIIKFINGVFKGDWKKAWDGVVDIFKGSLNIAMTTVEGILNAIITVINSAISVIWTGIKKLVNTLTEPIEAIANVLGKKIDLTLKGKAPQIGLVSLPRLKSGMDFVPSDYYPAYLDYGERVLTKEENAAYTAALDSSGNFTGGTTVSPTIIVQVGDKQIAKQVLSNLQNMAKTNGKAITITG